MPFSIRVPSLITPVHCITQTEEPGIEGVVIGEGESYQEALEDAKSALRFHIETFGVEVLDTEYSVLEASIIVR